MAKKKGNKMAQKIDRAKIELMAKCILLGEATLDPDKETDDVVYIPERYHKAVQAWLDGYYANKEGK